MCVSYVFCTTTGHTLFALMPRVCQRRLVISSNCPVMIGATQMLELGSSCTGPKTTAFL